MFLNHRPGPDRHAGLDDAVRTHLHIVRQLGPAIHDCCWMNFCHTCCGIYPVRLRRRSILFAAGLRHNSTAESLYPQPPIR